jgi:hypothetical protein
MKGARGIPSSFCLTKYPHQRLPGGNMKKKKNIITRTQQLTFSRIRFRISKRKGEKEKERKEEEEEEEEEEERLFLKQKKKKNQNWFLSRGGQTKQPKDL